MHRQRDILPLPIEVSEFNTLRFDSIRQRRSGSRVRSRKKRSALVAEIVLDLADSLNSLYGVVGQGSPSGEPNLCQQLALQHLKMLGDEVCRYGLARLEATSVVDDANAYKRMISDKDLWLEPGRISLPLNEVAGSVSMIDLLPKEVGEKYLKEQSILQTNLSEVKHRKAFKGVKQGKYRELIEKLVSNGMVEVRREKPKVINGVFGVPKQEQQRLIIDARNANEHFIEPDDPNLPNPGVFTGLQLAADKTLFCAKSDLDNFYHRLRLPSWLTTYFGLPPITVNGEERYPVVLTMPMGWSHSVYVAQKIHEELLRRCGVIGEREVRSEDCEIRGFQYGAYIDDYFSIGTDKEKAAKLLERVIEECRVSGVPAKESKIVRPGIKMTIILGVEIHDNGILRPARDKLADLLRFTKWFVKLRGWKKKTLQNVLGRWAWTVLLKRNLFSVLDKVYLGTTGETEYFKPTKAMRNELRLMCRLSPLIRVDLRKTFSETIICTDASLLGGSVVYFKATPCLARRVGNMNLAEREKWANSVSWCTAIKHKWCEKEQIHLLEGEALILGMRWLLRSKESLHKRVVIMGDNQSLIGAVCKGRSSKSRFNRICQRVASLALAGDVEIVMRYISSKNNPADGPSRFK